MRYKTKLAIVLSLILCLVSSVGFTLAYFTDYENAKGGAVVKLGGRTEITEEVDGNIKVVAITNVGKEPDDVDMVVRIMAFGENLSYTPEKPDDWKEGSDGAWYYTKILKPGATTSKLTITVSGHQNPEDPIDYDVTVVHESQRVAYDGDKVAVPEGWMIDSINAE